MVGHSSGGVVALEAMAASPSAFAGAVLYEPPVVIGPPLGVEALVPHQLDDLAAIDDLGGRLDAYTRIDVPIVLLGGDRSPAHAGERIDVLAATLPHAEKVTMRRQGHGAHRRAPGDVARVIENLADKVFH